jgi:NADH:ubiquinone oxidoreductase subunit E
MLRGSTDILNAACSHLGGIKPGETTTDGKFTVIEVECQGACSNAPMMVVNDDFYVRLTIRKVIYMPIVRTGGSNTSIDKEGVGRFLEW